MSRALLSISIGTLLVACTAPALAQDPTDALGVYLACLERGDLDGALTYCALPGTADPQALRELRASMDGVAAEVDLPGVVKALSLFVPLSPAPMEWRPKGQPMVVGDEAVLDLTVTTTLVFDQRVHFLRTGPGWRIDLQKTFATNCEGTRIAEILGREGSLAREKAQLARIGRAMARFSEEHGWRLPAADTWREDLLAYSDLVTAEDFASPAVAAGEIGYAMNANLAGLLGRDIKAPSRTVLVFDSVPGTSSGTQGALDARHNGKALVLMADGHTELVASAADCEWGARPLGPAGGATTIRTTWLEGGEMVALRDVLVPLGGAVEWRERDGYSVAQALGHRVHIRPGDTELLVDGAKLRVPAAALIVEGTLYVPVSLPSRTLGLSVRWVSGGVEYR